MISGTDKSRWTTSTNLSDDGVVRTPGVERGFKHPLIVVIAVVIVTMVAWSLFRAPTRQVEGLVGEIGNASTSLPATSTSAVDDDAAADDAVIDDDGSSSTTVNDFSPVFDVDVDGLDPALTRYDLFASRPGKLLRIDLADGVVTTFDVPGDLVGAFAGRLYFVDSATGITWRPVDNPGAEGSLLHGLPPENRDIESTIVTADGILHLSYGLLDDSRFVYTNLRINLETGADQIYEPNGFGVFGLVWVPGAGLFENADDGFRALADATVLLPGERLIVVEECSGPEQCRRYWLDRSSGEEVDRPVPDADFGYVIGPTGSVVATIVNGRPVYLDGASGNELPIEVETTDDPGLTVAEGLTPDGRFLAVVDGLGAIDVLIYDLVADEQWVLELPRGRRFSKLVLVPREGDE